MFTKVYHSIALACSAKSQAALNPDDELFQATAKFIQVMQSTCVGELLAAVGKLLLLTGSRDLYTP